MDTEVEITDLSRFSAQELTQASEVLEAYAKDGADWFTGKVHLCLNVQNRHAYLVDTDDNAAMLDDSKQLRQWWWCGICNADGFDGDVAMIDGERQVKEFTKYDGYCSAACQEAAEG